jgi:DNA-binding protein HU-beta
MAKATVTKPKAPVKASAKVAKTPVKKERVAAAKSESTPPPKPPPANTITLKHLAASLAERHEMPKQQLGEIVETLFVSIVDHLKAGDRVRINGLGIIEVKDRPARMGRNPATGEAIQIKASKKIAFRASKELKDTI